MIMLFKVNLRQKIILLFMLRRICIFRVILKKISILYMIMNMEKVKKARNWLRKKKWRVLIVLVV